MISQSKKKFLNWFKNTVRQTLRESGFTPSYIPYKSTLNEYFISGTKENYPLCELGLPLPPGNLRSGYPDDNTKYFNVAKEEIDSLLKLLKESGFEINSSKKILDFGCSTGRLIRHLKPYSDKIEIWGVDISAECISWANNYLNPPFHFATTTIHPHLPFEDKYFDLIYCCSVFTHIDNFTESWLLELRRVLSGNGRIYITIHDHNTIDFLEKRKNILLSKFIFGSKTFNEARNNFEIIALNRFKSPQIFFNIDYIKKLLNTIFDISSVTEGSYGYQTGIVLKRKSK